MSEDGPLASNVFDRRVRWGETDAAGIVFYPNYYIWFDEATHELFRAHGCPVSGSLDDGYAVPLLESAAHFRVALRYDDLISIHSVFTDIHTRTFRVNHRVYRESELVCDGHEVRIWVRVGAAGMESAPIPAHVRLAAESTLREPAP